MRFAFYEDAKTPAALGLRGNKQRINSKIYCQSFGSQAELRTLYFDACLPSKAGSAMQNEMSAKADTFPQGAIFERLSL